MIGDDTEKLCAAAVDKVPDPQRSDRRHRLSTQPEGPTGPGKCRVREAYKWRE